MKTKSGYVAIIGKPNVGKSTLMNAMLGEKLSIITNKPQTTRKRVLGILSEEECQIIFLDTPGILKPKYLLQEKLAEYIKTSILDADIVVVMIDITSDEVSDVMESESVRIVLENKDLSKLAVINKIDKSNEYELNKVVEKLSDMKVFNSVIPISALNKFNTESVVANIKELLPEGPKYYPDDQLSDADERFFVTEIIREKVFEKYKEEIPFSTEVLIEEFKEQENRKDYISAVIVVERESQKPIIIGKKGESIKKLGQIAREAIEEFLGRSVFLELRVKVRSKWRSNPNILKSFGYNTDNE